MEMEESGCYLDTQQPEGHGPHHTKRARTAGGAAELNNRTWSKLAAGIEDMPDEILATILGAVALSVQEILSVGTEYVSSKASCRCLAVRAKNWSVFAEHFLQQCAESGNIEASFILGMIRFYCTRDRNSGADLILAATTRGHKDAIYSLAVIVFNGSGGTRENRDIRAGVALCARAASLGHVSALRELGFCLQDGYGVDQSVSDGRRLIILAKAREMAQDATGSPSLIGASVLKTEPIANSFMVDWFEERKNAQQEQGGRAPSQQGTAGPALRMCSNHLCGREETRKREFRRCSICASVNYCSRACQARHWSLSHKEVCTPA